MSVRSLSLALALAVPLALAIAPGVARAADPNPEERALADVRFHEGRELLDKQRLDDACAKFEESERLWPRGGTVLNLAACREKQGKLATAWAAYTRALPLAEKEGRADRVELARSKVADLQGQLSWLVIQVPAELDVPGAVITRDGVPVGRGAWNTPIPVDPGRHVVVANVPGTPPIEAVVDVGARGDRRAVTLPRTGGGPHVLPQAAPWMPLNQLPPPDPGGFGVVRAHVETTRPGITLFRGANPQAPAGMNTPVCAPPCDAVLDGRYGQAFYFDGPGLSASTPFYLADRKGDLVVRAKPGSAALAAVGSTSAFLGLLAAIGGGSTLLTGVIVESNDTRHTGSSLVPVGGVLLGAGGVLLGAGIAMMLVGRTSYDLEAPAGGGARAGALGASPAGTTVAF